jgi:carbonic anhydrase
MASIVDCSKATAPVNIDTNGVTDTCSLKCELSFSYNDSSCVARNQGEYISLSYDQTKSSPVIYNLTSYTVSDIRIYQPSLHTYNGNRADGELIIIHNSNTANLPLLICVPIIKGSSTSTSATVLSTIISDISKNAPKNGDKTTVNIKKYNLNDFVPRKPFYTYVATQPYIPCSTTNNNYVVFTPSQGYINITDATYKVLTNVITKQTYTIKKITNETKNLLAYNPKGPVTMSNDSQIYIDCQPVGQSDESEIVVNNIGTTNPITAANTLSNPVVQLFLGSLIFIIFIMGIYKLLDAFKVTRAATQNGGFFSANHVQKGAGWWKSLII